MSNNTYTPDNKTYIPRFGTVRGTFFIVIVVLALGMGLALASPSRGATLTEDPKGDITGSVTVNGQGTAGISVELRQRTNGGGDASLVTATTDGTGTYHFSGQASAASDAFYYVRFTGGKGTLSAWYSFPIIYVSGSEITVPSVELTDVELVAPGQNVSLPLPGSLRWKARKMGETYRLFVYAAGKNDKPVLDSGSLGTGTEFPVPEGGLPAGKYEAVVQVRDVVAGYGQSQARFRFTVGPQAQGNVTTAPTQNNPANSPTTPEDSQKGQGTDGTTTAPPAQSQGSNSAKTDLKVNLSADKTSVSAGDSILYKVEVENTGTGQASGVVVTDKLPAGVSVDKASIKATAGQVSLEGGTVTVNVGDLAPGSKTSVEIPISVGAGTGSNLSNQASATYNGATDAVQSNAYIAQVAAPLTGASGSPPQQPAQQQAAPPSGAANPPSAQPQKPAAAPKSEAASGTQNSTQAKPATAPAAKKAAAPMPQTGGAFPVVLATILALLMLAARYLRGLAYRRT